MPKLTPINSKKNVNKIKKEFGNDVRLSLVIKNFENQVEKTLFNIDNVDSYLKKSIILRQSERF